VLVLPTITMNNNTFKHSEIIDNMNILVNEAATIPRSHDSEV